ncbi:3' terminal RNA ribose 2'-O-methyltransferase Hen1 [Sulfidibacter corallicola]|uniref:Small RNA 2'-O-methyltransferase n=1 Tax=Sulfidibacter corallicola TaxID=2818388 RepID=A0A8A4TSC3_SULCO|nr:3' terminal RNA ribose 2'-O-methyltransferase Hen1 [Sulfidibacter corallicola]QTD52450.1 3' terminal RNA ribose 2'-O-methyltransferase Hen1 [Sulfidibacter corallicola]
MLMTITNTLAPATDLGFLLHKHPDRLQTFELSFGKAHVFYPVAEPERCTAALLLDIDPIDLVRSFKAPPQTARSLQHYVNDRPYVASSFLSTAISRVFGTALSGTCNPKPELPDRALPLTVTFSAIPCRGGEALLRDLFEPLGYGVEAQGHPLDANFPEWGDSPYFTVTLTKTCRLQDLLSHVYVLIPVLDREKHYYVDRQEIEKLLHHGDCWLADHPARDLITRRYLSDRRSLTRIALDRLREGEAEPEDASEEATPTREERLESKISLNELRMKTVMATLAQEGAQSVADLGCGEGRLLQGLLRHKQFKRVLGLDVNHRDLEIAARRLKLEHLAPAYRERVTLIHGSLLYRDHRLRGFDAACLMEVIEHMELERLTHLEGVVFGDAMPRLVLVTTPNVEYNATFETLPEGTLRHADHRFEWTRAEFRAWAEGVAQRHGYQVEFAPIGERHEVFGPPTQMAVFRRSAS